MSITAKVSAIEISNQVTQRFVDKYVEALLINAPGVSYSPGLTQDATFLSFEVASAAGYERQVFTYQTSDRSIYSDSGVSLATKGSIFAHDGGEDSIDFTHAVIVWGSGNVAALDAASTDPDTGVDGIYTDLPTITNGAGTGLTVDLTVSNNIFVFSPSRYGRNYQAGDTVTVLEATMEAAGAISAGDGLANMTIATVSSNTEAGQIIAVAPIDSPVTLDGGNEAVFFWDLKLYGVT